MPGLIDAHVHIGSLPQMRAAVQSGVTTARSAGVSSYVDVGLRELVKRGTWPARTCSPPAITSGRSRHRSCSSRIRISATCSAA